MILYLFERKVELNRRILLHEPYKELKHKNVNSDMEIILRIT